VTVVDQRVLAIEDLSVAYGKRRALEGVSLTVGAGEIVTLLGANGSGKSTTLRTVSGLVRAARGVIRYQGRDIARWPPDAIVAAGIGHVPEGRDIFPEFSVLENLLVGAHTVAAREVPARLEAAYALFPTLRDRRRQRAGTLSGGEQQMLAIGRALMARPRVLLLDEPSLGLAPRLVREIFAIIRRVNAEGVAVLLVEQNARAALALAARGYVLETGRVVAAGASAALALDPRIRAAYLGLDRAGPDRAAGYDRRGERTP
jgi:branched-chain amino acid transport system ATP-binding protein